MKQPVTTLSTPVLLETREKLHARGWMEGYTHNQRLKHSRRLCAVEDELVRRGVLQPLEERLRPSSRWNKNDV